MQQTRKQLAMSLSILVFSTALFIRLAVSLHSYSGAGKHPMYGDYEAQRHWMEITYNLEINEWYTNGSDNNLHYWGLDYPPLTAYHSWACGVVAAYLNPEWIALNTSHGYESYEHKLYMRYTVVVVDVMVFFTAVYAYVSLLVSSNRGARNEKYIEQAAIILLLLLQPGLVLIDHGHFQYNCVSLGLALWGVVGVISNHDLLGSVAFTLALNYKQMELYHALPFFFYLLGKACQTDSSTDSTSRVILKVIKLGVAVLGTFFVCWAPILFAGGSNAVLQVFRRMFPFNRGLYEDKVSNFWCSVSLLFKIRQIFTQQFLISLSFVTTLLSVLPSSVSVFRNPTPYQFLLSLANTSLAFFLFSFQVHEKSILLAALPVCLLTTHHPYFSTWFNMVAVFSMYPLLVKDGLVLVTWGLTGLYSLVSVVFLSLSFNVTHRIHLFMFALSTSVLLSLCALSHFIPPPPNLPDIFPVLISGCSCLLFILFLLYINWLQLFGTSTSTIIRLNKNSKGSQLYQKVGRSNINLTLFSHPIEKEHAD